MFVVVRRLRSAGCYLGLEVTSVTTARSRLASGDGSSEASFLTDHGVRVESLQSMTSVCVLRSLLFGGVRLGCHSPRREGPRHGEALHGTGSFLSNARGR